MENIEAGEGDWDKGEGKGSEEILVSMLGHDVFCLGWVISLGGPRREWTGAGCWTAPVRHL